jgi:hypothetical protein
MNALGGYNTDDLIASSQMWFNDRRLPADLVSITIRNVRARFGHYLENQLAPLTQRTALEICSKHQLNDRSWQTHLVRISVRDTPEHEILSYEWVFKYGWCMCR